MTSRIFEWNTLEADLFKLYDMLAGLGVEYRQGRVYLGELNESHVK